MRDDHRNRMKRERARLEGALGAGIGHRRLCQRSGSRQSAKRVPLRHVSRISHVAIERLDVVAVGIEQERRVVARSVRSVARGPVRAEAGLDACSMEGIDLFPRFRHEAEMQIRRRRLAVDDVDPREAHHTFNVPVLRPGRDSERGEDCRVETHARLEVARMNFNVVDDVLRPVPYLFAHLARNSTFALSNAFGQNEAHGLSRRAVWLVRLPTVWVEGEVTELRRQQRWASVFFTLKDPGDGACLGVSMPRAQFDALRLDLVDGERVHVYGRPELFEARGDFRLRALSVERFGLGDHLAALERLKRKLAAEGLFEQKRPLPRFPSRIGLVTGNDAAAKRDVLTTISARFPPARVVVAETYVQGPRAAAAIVAAMTDLCRQPDVDVIVLARGGGSFEDLRPFSDERLVRAVASCPRPVVSAVGHEQDTPLCDLAADVRASTPTMAGKLVVPDLAQLSGELDRARATLARSARRI